MSQEALDSANETLDWLSTDPYSHLVQGLHEGAYGDTSALSHPIYNLSSVDEDHHADYTSHGQINRPAVFHQLYYADPKRYKVAMVGGIAGSVTSSCVSMISNELNKFKLPENKLPSTWNNATSSSTSSDVKYYGGEVRLPAVGMENYLSVAFEVDGCDLNL